MKYFKTILYLLLLFPILSGCDELEELVEQEFDIETSFIKSLTIQSPMTSDINDLVNFESDVISYNFATDPNIVGIINDPSEIKKIRINSVLYEYKNFSGNVDAAVEGDFMIARSIMDNQRFSTPLINVALADLTNELFNLDEDFSDVSDLVSKFKVIVISYSGLSQGNPVDFTIEVTVNITVTIKPNLNL